MAWTEKSLPFLPVTEISLVCSLNHKPRNKFTFGNQDNHGNEFHHIYHSKVVALAIIVNMVIAVVLGTSVAENLA
jgi:hypothetical protein